MYIYLWKICSIFWAQVNLILHENTLISQFYLIYLGKASTITIKTLDYLGNIKKSFLGVSFTMQFEKKARMCNI